MENKSIKKVIGFGVAIVLCSGVMSINGTTLYAASGGRPPRVKTTEAPPPGRHRSTVRGRLPTHYGKGGNGKASFMRGAKLLKDVSPGQRPLHSSGERILEAIVKGDSLIPSSWDMGRHLFVLSEMMKEDFSFVEFFEHFDKNDLAAHYTSRTTVEAFDYVTDGTTAQRLNDTMVDMLFSAHAMLRRSESKWDKEFSSNTTRASGQDYSRESLLGMARSIDRRKNTRNRIIDVTTLNEAVMEFMKSDQASLMLKEHYKELAELGSAFWDDDEPTNRQESGFNRKFHDALEQHIVPIVQSELAKNSNRTEVEDGRYLNGLFPTSLGSYLAGVYLLDGDKRYDHFMSLRELLFRNRQGARP